MPEYLLYLLYGNGSPYLNLSFGVQALLVAGVAEYVAEMISKTLLGVERGKLAFKVNVAGIAAAVFALPLIIPLGVVGACLALAIANLVRLIVAMMAITRLIGAEKAQPPGQKTATVAAAAGEA
jgi:O-antigen/teichoic acid export membrane protein